MLSFLNRFHGHGSLKYVYKRGDVRRSQFFTLKYCENPRREATRVAVVVSKKVHKSAVVRNRIRRRLYEVFREQLPGTQGVHDIVCIVTNLAVKDLPTEDLTNLVSKALSEAGLCKNT